MEDILARTDPLTLQKIYNLPTFGSTLEFLTMLSLTTGRLLKAPIFLVPVLHVSSDRSHYRVGHQTSSPPLGMF